MQSNIFRVDFNIWLGMHEYIYPITSPFKDNLEQPVFAIVDVLTTQILLDDIFLQVSTSAGHRS